MPKGGAPDYVIDTCAIMDLHGYNLATCLTADPGEREIGWQNLLHLIEIGRVVTVQAAREEVKRNAPECYERLKPVHSVFFKRDSALLIVRAGEILDAYPSLVSKLDERPNEREPADPYIIAYGEQNNITVVTNEKPRSQRSRNNRSGLRIPDVCDALGIDWLNLADFAAVVRLLEVETPDA